MNLPLIGITLDTEEPGSYSKFPWYAVRENYGAAVAAGGGLPIMLPHETHHVDSYLGAISGLLVTGGAFDVDPALFGAASRHPSIVVKSKRTEFEWAMTEGALSRNMPVLGICGGQQLLNVVLGGTLIQHIPDEIEDPLAHEQPNPRDEAGHNATIVENTLLHYICGKTELSVNSAHHQAVKEVNFGDGDLLLCDMFGGTPSNLSLSFLAEDVEVVTGVNLPMLLKLYTQRESPLLEVASAVQSHGRDNIRVAGQILKGPEVSQ